MGALKKKKKAFQELKGHCVKQEGNTSLLQGQSITLFNKLQRKHKYLCYHYDFFKLILFSTNANYTLYITREFIEVATNKEPICYWL